MKKTRGFTLAEVLIVIGIIGIVAAITIPTLINTISTKAKKSQTDVIEARLLDGINRYSAMEDGLSQKYDTTYDFLVGLSKYYKMSQICKADEISKCIPYSKIYSSDGSKSADVKSLKTIHSFMPSDGAKDYLAPASFISAQGTPFVMALKKNCVWDMGQAMHEIEDSECIAYLYDKNGAALPNKVGSDLVGHGLTINGFPLVVLGGVKIMTNAFITAPGLTLTECQTEMAKADEYKSINSGIYVKTCPDISSVGGDRWAYAMKYCKEKGYHIPTLEQLVNIANALYKGMNATTGSYSDTYAGKDANNQYYRAGSNEPLPDALSGLDSSWNYMWSSLQENSGNGAYGWVFGRTYTRSFYAGRYNNQAWAVCVSD